MEENPCYLNINAHVCRCNPPAYLTQTYLPCHVNCKTISMWTMSNAKEKAEEERNQQSEAVLLLVIFIGS